VSTFGPRIWRFAVISTTAAIILAACCTATQLPVISRDQAAGVLLSSIAIPWQEVASSLQPNFTMSGDTAAQQVAPVTQEAQLAVLSALGANLSVGALVGPFKPPASGATAQTTPSSIPTPQAPTGVPTGATLPTAAPNASLPIDSMLKFRAGNALFQFVQLLNADLTSSLLTDKYVPYVVRTKLAVTPYRANLPYDLYAQLAFFVPPGCKKQKGNDTDPCLSLLPIVVPLLVTDDIERAASSAAAETAQQLGIALSVLAPYAQASGSLDSVKQQLQSLTGQNYDSLLTVGRDADNSVSARIGAAYQTVARKDPGKRKDGDTTTRALVGQNYDIATIVLVPKEYFSAREADPALNLVAYTELRNTNDGTVLPRRPNNVYVALFDTALNDTVSNVNTWAWYKKWKALPVAEEYEQARVLVGPVQSGKFAEFLNTYCEWAEQGTSPDSPCISNPEHQYEAQNLWTRLASTLPDSAFKTTLLALPFLKAIDIPDQIVTVLDDGKSSMQAQVRTNAAALGTSIVATLALVGENEKKIKFTIPLISKITSFDQTTGILTFQFASAASNGISGVDMTGSTLTLSRQCDLASGAHGDEGKICTELTKIVSASDVQQKPNAKTQKGNTLELKASYVIAKASAGPTPGFTFASGAKQIAAINGTGTVNVYFPTWKTAESTATITVDGASIVSTSAGTLANGQVTIAKPGASVTMQLMNLVPGVPVTVQAEGKTGKATSTGKASIPLTVLPGDLRLQLP
jgi:hypothetical protein